MIFYHGTSYEAGLNILENGFQACDTIWTCSDESMTYLVSQEYDGGPFDDIPNPDNTPAFRFAVGAGQISAATVNQIDDKLVVFEFDIPDEFELECDTSCYNMHDCYQIDNDELNEYIKSGEIGMKVYIVHKAYVYYLRPFYIKDIISDYYVIEDDCLADVVNTLKQEATYWFYDKFMEQYDYYEIMYETHRLESVA